MAFSDIDTKFLHTHNVSLPGKLPLVAFEQKLIVQCTYARYRAFFLIVLGMLSNAAVYKAYHIKIVKTKPD